MSYIYNFLISDLALAWHHTLYVALFGLLFIMFLISSIHYRKDWMQWIIAFLFFSLLIDRIMLVAVGWVISIYNRGFPLDLWRVLRHLQLFCILGPSNYLLAGYLLWPTIKDWKK